MTTLEGKIAEIWEKNKNSSSWEVPEDYFSWGRDKRHQIKNDEALPVEPNQKNTIEVLAKWKRSILNRIRNGQHAKPKNDIDVLAAFHKTYGAFSSTYEMMSDNASKNLFAELIYMKIVSPANMRLASFTKEFIDTYEIASDELLASKDELPVYGWLLKRIRVSDPDVDFYTVPTILNLHLQHRLYEYAGQHASVSVAAGDVVIDCGVGWGDTTVYLAAKACRDRSGRLFAFDILQEGMDVLARQIQLNDGINIEPVLMAVSDTDDEEVSISQPGPGSRVVEGPGVRRVKTGKIDTFISERNISSIDFIKMDIEGAEVPALNGASHTIKMFKPKLAISVYHKWDDLLTIPSLINSIRNDYEYYLDCTTGFGGETVLYCR